VDDQSNEVPVTTTIPQLPHAVVDVRPGDQDAATTVEAWLQDYATSRDPQLRERIILAYLGVADRLARRFRDSRGTSAEDLVQTARAGVIAAIDRYDPGYGTPFVPYAVACVVGELKRHLRDTSWRLHIARPLKERSLRLCRAADELHQRLGRSPTTAELAEQLDMDEEEVLDGLAAGAAAMRCRWTSQSATNSTVHSASWWSRRQPGRSQRTCRPCPAWCRPCRSWSAR
jgi:RNA polymerase sigma factor (sigma-70 family)